MSGQPVSTVLSSIGSVDSSLRTGLAQAETSTSDAFGASLDHALTQEHSQNSGQQLRQLPAGVGNLSEISLALAKNDPAVSLVTVENTGNGLLANNLLQQIAFTKKSTEAELTAETSDIKLTDTKAPITTGPVLVTDDPDAEPKLTLPDATEQLPSKTVKPPVVEGNPVRITDETKPELVLPNGPDKKQDKTTRPPVMEGSPVRITDETKPELVLPDGPDKKQDKTTRPPVMEGSPVRITDETKPELVLPDGPDKKQDKTTRPPVMEGNPVGNTDKTKPELELPEAPDKKQDKTTRPPVMEGNPVGTTDETSPKLDLLNQPSHGLIRSGTQPIQRDGPITIDIGGRPDPEIGIPVKPIFSQGNISLATAANKEQTKVDDKTPAKSKASLADKVDTDKMTSSAKQSEVSAQLAEKLTASSTGASRQESSFAATLASSVTNTQASAVESRLATAANNASQVASHTEQLKQSINLMKQDAAGHMRQQVSMMLSQQIQKAEIRLDPAGLGMMQIKIDMQQEQATVQFTVQQQQAKELIEQQLPRLREMLQQQGIQLSEGQVQQQSQQQQQQRQLAQQGQQNQSFAQGEDANGEQLGMPIKLVVKHSERLVDYYA
ncbi:flagellar hook-length control protein FliK [Rheinheimera sp. WS51]|uniref:flagellar hook-length control protein FliK n=1 Tax=Rheinheimera sp. WS51 TaxID=3425886 RepID=UPI003D90F97B